MKIINNTIVFDSGFQVLLHRTIKVPENSTVHRLPPSFGLFPIERIQDYRDKVPVAWRDQGGVFIPMFENEAMWMGFLGTLSAVKVATGKVNALSGKEWKEELEVSTRDPSLNPEQDHMVAPYPQKWLDGFNVGQGKIRQFVGAVQGEGVTVEGQVTGDEKIGGIQIIAYPMKKRNQETSYSRGLGTRKRVGNFLHEENQDGSSSVTLIDANPEYIYDFAEGTCSMGEMESSVISTFHSPQYSTKSLNKGGQHTNSTGNGYSRIIKQEEEKWNPLSMQDDYFIPVRSSAKEIGIAQGGTIQQNIYTDPYGIEYWDQTKGERIFIHIVNETMWTEITGKPCPKRPKEMESYKGAWFSEKTPGHSVIDGSATLSNVNTIAEKNKEKLEFLKDKSFVEDGTW